MTNNIHLPVLTTSAAKKYRACPRAFRLEYVDGYRAAHVDPNRRFGTLGHTGLEARWRWYEPMGAAIYETPIAAAIAALGDVEDPYERARAEALLAGYDARWTDDGDLYEVLGVEVEYVMPLVNPATHAESKTWRTGGKLDAIVRERATGRVLVVEHKTSSEDITPGSDYWTRLTLDSQVSNYLAGARTLGPRLGFDPTDVAGVLYDVIGKPALRPLQATPVEARKYTKPTKAEPVPRLYANQLETDETVDEYRERLVDRISSEPDRYFRRGEIVRLETEVAEAAQDMWQTGVAIKDARRLGHFPRNSDACSRYGRTCSFLPVCLGVASLDDETSYRRAERPNEELAGASA